MADGPHAVIDHGYTSFYPEKGIRQFGQYNQDHPFSLFLKNNIGTGISLHKLYQSMMVFLLLPVQFTA